MNGMKTSRQKERNVYQGGESTADLMAKYSQKVTAPPVAPAYKPQTYTPQTYTPPKQIYSGLSDKLPSIPRANPLNTFKPLNFTPSTQKVNEVMNPQQPLTVNGGSRGSWGAKPTSQTDYPSGVWGKVSKAEQGFINSKQYQEAANSPVGKAISRVNDSAINSTFLDNKPETTTGNKAVDTAADFLGFGSSLALTPMGKFMAPVGNLAERGAVKGLGMLAPKLPGVINKAAQFAVPTAARGAAEFGLYGGAQGVAQGKDIKGIAESAGSGALQGALFNLGGKVIGTAFTHAIKGIGKVKVLNDDGTNVVYAKEDNKIATMPKETFDKTAQPLQLSAPQQHLSLPQGTEAKLPDVIPLPEGKVEPVRNDIVNSNDNIPPATVKANTEPVQAVTPKANEEVIFNDHLNRINAGTVNKVNADGTMEVKTPEGNIYNVKKNGDKLETVLPKPTTETQVPIDNRISMSNDELKNSNVKAYQYIHPELKSHIQSEANIMLGELQASTKGENTYTKDIYNNLKISGNQRQTSSEIASLLDQGHSYDAIEKALNRIIKDNGSENTMLAKKIEVLLDQRLSNGYEDFTSGVDIPASKDYVDMKNSIEGQPKAQSQPQSPAAEVKTDTGINTEVKQATEPIINEANAKRAKENSGFSDYIPGRATSEYNSSVKQVSDMVEKAKLKVSDEGKVKLDNMLEQYKKDYADYINRYNANDAGHVSVMVAGPSNYDMGRQNKWMAKNGKLMQEYQDKFNNMDSKISSVVAGDKTIKSGDPEALTKLKDKLAKAQEEHQSYKDYNVKAKKEGKETLDSYVLQNSNARMKAIKDRIASVEKAQVEQATTPAETVSKGKYNGVEIVKNSEADRVQIVFDENNRPNAEVTQELKKNGWHYSPTNKAWQRKLTYNAETNADYIVKKHYGEPTTNPLQTFAGKTEPAPKDTNLKVPFKVDLASKANTKTSEFYSNSLKDTKILPEEVKKLQTESNYQYGVQTNEGQLNQAANVLKNNGINNEIDRLMKTPNGDAVDTAEHLLITKELVAEAKATGDYSKVNRWTKYTQDKVTNTAQSLQAVSMWKKMSPEGMLLQAQKQIEGAAKYLKGNNPKLTGKVAEEVKKAKETGTAQGMKETDIQKVIDKIYKKNNVPNLSDEDTKFILDTMTKAQGMPEGREKDIEIAKAIMRIANNIPTAFSDKIKGLQRISMLLNPKTMIRNIGGNIVMGGAENIKDIPASLIDMGVSKLTGKRTTLMPSPKGLLGQGKSMLQGVKNVHEDSKLGIDTSPSRGQYDVPMGKTYNDSKLGGKILNKLDATTKYGLQYGDTPFYKAAYNESIRQQLKIAKVDTPTEEMKLQAKDIAENYTFQNASDMSKGFDSLRKSLNKIGSKVAGNENFGLGNVVVPFTKTPANILDKALDYSPLSMVKATKMLYDAKTKGVFNQKHFVDILGRGLTGTGAILFAYDLAKKGLMVGQANSNMDAAALDKQTGKSPYAFHIGDTYYTFDWAQPMSIPFAIGADIFESGKTRKDTSNILIDAVKSGGQTLFNQSLLQGIQKMMGGYNPINGITGVLQGVPAQFAPTAFKQIAQMSDPTVRSSYDPSQATNTLNTVKAKLPGLSKTLEPKIDTLGQTTKLFQGSTNPLANAFNIFLNPGVYTKAVSNPGVDLVKTIYEKTGETKQFPKVAPKYFNDVDGNRIDLTPKEYTQYQTYLGQETNKYINSLSDTGDYTKLANDISNQITKINKDAKNLILQGRSLQTLKTSTTTSKSGNPSKSSKGGSGSGIK